MQISKELAGFSGRQGGRPAQGDRQEEPRGDGGAEARVRRGLPRVGHEARGDRVPVADQRKVGRLLVQQAPRRLLRADRLPHGLAEGQLHRRVHGGADLLGDVDQGQGAVLRRPLRGDGHRDPAPGRQPLRPRVHGRPERGQTRRRRNGNIRFGLDAVKGVGYQAVEAIKRARARRAGEFTLAVGLLRARRQPRGQQEGDRGADQVRRASARPARAARACWRCSSRRRPAARRSSRTR